MTRWLLLVVVLGIATISDHSIAAENLKDQIATLWQSSCNPWVDYNCAAQKVSPKTLRTMERGGNCDPYLDYKCLDTYLGNDFFTRFYRYYALEWGHGVAPSDATHLRVAAQISVWPATPQSTPPMPFTEWPYGGTTTIGVTRPNSVDSPLMVALSNTQLGAGMNASHVQVYGWVEVGGNVSTNSVKPGATFRSGTITPPIQSSSTKQWLISSVCRTQSRTITSIWASAYRRYTASIIATRQRTACSAISFSTTTSSMATTFRWKYVDRYFPVMQGLDVRIGRFITGCARGSATARCCQPSVRGSARDTG